MTAIHIVDDKSEHCIPFLLEQIEEHKRRFATDNPPPFLLGINGIQGAGKTTLVSTLKGTLSAPPHNLRTVVISLDDFYLRHEDQANLAKAHPDNPLIQHRGQPSTHDLKLLVSTLSSLRQRNLTKLPSYDKSAFNGAGDRTDPSTWEEVNRPGGDKIEVVVLEGWCTGFRALSRSDLQETWQTAKGTVDSGTGDSQLGRLKLENVELVNEALKRYSEVWDMFDAFIHIDAEDTRWVYAWRLEAEVQLRKEKGSGMTDEQVKRFVDGYYPAYELYTATLRAGVSQHKGRQLRLVVGRDRRVHDVERI